MPPSQYHQPPKAPNLGVPATTPGSSVFQFIKASQFFPVYCPQVCNYGQKISGKDTRGKPLDFTDADKAAIREGLAKLFTDLSLPGALT